MVTAQEQRVHARATHMHRGAQHPPANPRAALVVYLVMVRLLHARKRVVAARMLVYMQTASILQTAPSLARAMEARM